MKKIYTIALITLATSLYAQFNYQKTWATYYFGYSGISASIKDSQGNIVVTGDISNFENLAYYEAFTTAGAHQTALGGGKDCFLAKFDPAGNLLWATYYGGADIEYANTLEIDSNDNIYIGGYTRSNSGIATVGAFLTDIPIVGGAGFLTKFSPTGALLWGTYCYGVVSEIAIDQLDNIFVIGATNITINVATPGAYLENAICCSDAGAQYANWNGYINKFDVDGNRVSGTYVGKLNGSIDSPNASLKITISDSGDLFISGYVYPNSAASGFYASPGCFQSETTGLATGYVSKFNNALTQRLWSTYYGGNQKTAIRKIVVQGDALYFVGITSCTSDIATIGAHQTVFGGNIFDGFLAKFTTDGARQWATYYGGSGNDGGLVDIKIEGTKLYVVGSTTSSNNIATVGTYQQTMGGVEDGLFARFTTDGVREWGSYFGGSSDVDYVERVIPNGSESFYLVGTTNSTNNIATPNALQPNLSYGLNTSGGLVHANMFLAKFETPLATNNFLKSKWQLAPNPNSGEFVLQGSLNQSSAELKVVICDLQGRTIFSKVLENSENQISQSFQLQNKTDGMYIVKIVADQVVVETFKMVIK